MGFLGSRTVSWQQPKVGKILVELSAKPKSCEKLAISSAVQRQIVHGGRLGAVLGGHAPTLLVLLAVVEQLGTEELIHLAVQRLRHILVGLS